MARALGTTFCWYLSGASAPEGREKVAHGGSHGNKRVRQGAPERRKNPFTGIHPSPGTKGLLTPLRDWRVSGPVPQGLRDRKSTRLNSSHANISYAVFCLKKKKTTK